MDRYDFCYERTYWSKWKLVNILWFMNSRNIYDLFKDYSFEKNGERYLFTVHGANTGKIRESQYEFHLLSEGEATVFRFKYCVHPRWQIWRMPLTYDEIDRFMHAKLDAIPMSPSDKHA